MQTGVRNSLFVIAGFIALILGAFFFTFFSVRGLSDAQYRELGFYKFDRARAIGEFALINQDGESVTHADIRGQWSLLFFGFTFCPDVCPTTLATLAKAVETMQTPPRVVLVSVDPERDTPEALKAYLGSFDGRFLGFTGEFEEIVKLATQVNVAFGKVPGPTPGTYTVDHSASIVVVNPEGQYAGFIKAPHNAANITKIMESLM